MQYKYCRTADARLAYVEQGSGEALILLHGNGESSEYFKYQIEFFSQHFRVLALDSRGHGKSERGNGELTLARLADDLCAFMDSLSIEKANVLGFSDGGNIALLFALKYTDRLKKLVVNGANLDTRGVNPIFQFGVAVGYAMLAIPAKKHADARLKREIMLLMIGQPNITKQQLSCLNVPTLVVAGTHDIIRRKHTAFISSCIKNSRLCILDGGHTIARDCPDSFNECVYSFLKQ